MLGVADLRHQSLREISVSSAAILRRAQDHLAVLVRQNDHTLRQLLATAPQISMLHIVRPPADREACPMLPLPQQRSRHVTTAIVQGAAQRHVVLQSATTKIGGEPAERHMVRAPEGEGATKTEVEVTAQREIL